MARSFSKSIRRFEPNDIAEVTDLSPREAEVVYWVFRGLSEEEIAERMSVEVGTVKSFISKIHKKGDIAKTTLRTLTVSGIYEPADVSVEFLEKGDSPTELFDSEAIVEHIQEIVDGEEDLLREIDDHRRELSQMAKHRRQRLIELKARFAETGVIETDPWEVMDWQEREAYVLDAINQIAALTEEPAPAHKLLDKVKSETNAPTEDVRTAMDRLRTKGQIYEPKSNHFRQA